MQPLYFTHPGILQTGGIGGAWFQPQSRAITKLQRLAHTMNLRPTNHMKQENGVETQKGRWVCGTVCKRQMGMYLRSCKPVRVHLQ
jgi:hypothetical protein